MPLTAESQRFLDALAISGQPPLDQLPLDQARAQVRPTGKPPEEVAECRNLTTDTHPALPLRLYRPAGTPPDTPLPAIVYFHGGGWVLGNLESHDGLCRELCNRTACTVVAVDYRLAPEHPYPAAAEDSHAAIAWIAAHADSLGIDAGRLIPAGDSAGGNLASVACLMARDRGGPTLAAQVLIYPITDCRFDTGSYRAFATDHMLTAASMRWFWDNYVPDELRRDEPYASPLRAPDLSNLPPALVITAEFDPLRDEGDALAERLQAAGTPVEHWQVPGLLHGYLRRSDQFPQALETMEQIGDYLNRTLSPPAT